MSAALPEWEMALLGVPAESTAAALRRTERERDHARDDLALARAEMARAQTELDALRTARDNLDRQLAEARAQNGGRDTRA